MRLFFTGDLETSGTCLVVVKTVNERHCADYRKLDERLEVYFKKELKLKGKSLWETSAQPAWWDYVLTIPDITGPLLVARPVRTVTCAPPLYTRGVITPRCRNTRSGVRIDDDEHVSATGGPPSCCHRSASRIQTRSRRRSRSWRRQLESYVRRLLSRCDRH